MILSCHHITKSFGETIIINNAVFGIEDHEKCALTGINGAGKSTLLKIITSQLEADSGEVVIARGKTLGYLAQQDMTVGSRTIYEEAAVSRQALIEMEQALRDVEKEMKYAEGERLDELMQQYHRLSTDFEEGGGYAVRSEITGVLRGLGFTEDDFQRRTDTLSGGQKTRVALGRLLLSSPDILLLDEPTNHLDISSITWLEGYLNSYSGAVLIVSHDRYFLNRIVSKVVEIDRAKVTVFPGNYTAYAHRKKQLREEALRAYLNQQQQIRHQEEVIERLRSYNREKSIRRAESRVKMLDKLERVEKPVETDNRIKLDLEPETESGKDVLYIEGLSKSFGPDPLFTDLNLFIRRGERVALIGDNGTGKTTILRIINNLCEADAGSITLGAGVTIGYYDQDHQVLHPDKTLFDEISDEYPDLNNTRIRNILAAFLFTGDDVFKRIRDLSGGERGRVSLAKLMLSRANFLILDEPTNHLDVESKEILESALCHYTGTILYVSHDRYFINETCTRIVELKGCRLFEYQGNYDYYLEKSMMLRSDETSLNAPADDSATTAKSDWRKSKEEQARIRKRKNDLKKTEDRIQELETEDQQIDEALTREEIYTDLKKCMQLGNRKKEIAQELETLYAVWEDLAQ